MPMTSHSDDESDSSSIFDLDSLLDGIDDDTDDESWLFDDPVLGLISKSRLNAEDRKRHSYLADFFENQLLLDLVEDDRTSTFTHSDLQMKNILVREIPSREFSQGKDYDVSIVDWESAGWYPSYWEYVAAFFAFTWDSDWSNRVADIVDAWPAEAAMMKMIYQDLCL